jgi:hypothetical protein
MVMNLARRAALASGDSGEGENGAVIPFPVTLYSLLFLDGWKWNAHTMSGALYIGGSPASINVFHTPGFLVAGWVNIANSMDGKNVTFTFSVGKSETVFTGSVSPASLYFGNETRSDTSMMEISLVNFSDYMLQAEYPGTYEIHVNFSPPVPFEADTLNVTVTPPSSSLYPSSISPPPIIYGAEIATISITDPKTFVKQLDASKAVEEGVKRALLPFATKLV